MWVCSVSGAEITELLTKTLCRLENDHVLAGKTHYRTNPVQALAARASTGD